MSNRFVVRPEPAAVERLSPALGRVPRDAMSSGVVAAALGVALAAALGCGRRSGDVGSSDAVSDVPAAQTPAARATVDPARALDVGRYLSDDGLRGAHGTCLKTDGASSRIVYAVLGHEGSYFRLNVVWSHAAPAMVEFTRGVAEGGIWTATLMASRGTVQISSFASASDRAPVVTQLSADGAEGQLLKSVGSAAVHVSCSAS